MQIIKHKIFPDGTEIWYKNDKIHKEYGPSCIDSNGSEHWMKNNLYYREDGPAKIEINLEYMGGEHWGLSQEKTNYIYPQFTHRINGPAQIFFDGYERWVKNGMFHRTGGPAEFLVGGGELWWEEGEPL